MPATVPDVITSGSMAMIDQPRIPIDDRLVLRPWIPADGPAVVAAFSDPDIVRWHARSMTTVAEAEQWIEQQRAAWTDEQTASFAIADRIDETVLGRTALHTDLAQGWAEIAYWVLPRARGNAVATRAGRAATSWGHQFGFHRIHLEHSTANGASCRVADRLGYTAEGIKRQATRHADGWHDMHVHAHLSSDA